MKQQTVVSEAYGTGDLSEKIKPEKFVEGENVIFQDADGQKLIAIVHKGVISEWVARDGDGTEVPTVAIRQPAVEPKRIGPKPNRAKGFYKVCACYASGDRCWWVRWF